MKKSFVNNLSFGSDQEATKIILALFAGIAAGSVLATLLVSKNKYNLVDRLLSGGNSRKVSDAVDDATFAHPEKYFDAGDDVVIQPT